VIRQQQITGLFGRGPGQGGAHISTSQKTNPLELHENSPLKENNSIE